MRMNLTSTPSGPALPGTLNLPISLTVQPSCGIPGKHVYATDSAALMRLLKETDLPSTVLKRFHSELYTLPSARLRGVKLSDRALTQMGYFCD